MKVFQMTVTVGTEDDSFDEEKITHRFKELMAEDFIFFRVDRVKLRTTSSGEFSINMDEAERLGLVKKKN